MEISSNDPRALTIGANSKRCPTLSVSLGDSDRNIQWDVLVEVRRGEEGFATVGTVRSLPIGASGPRVRLLVQACVVGALEWAVTCKPVEGTIPKYKDVRADLGLAVEECCPSTPGFFLSDYVTRPQ